jgi:inosine-uridine nucleoside N-ribohydrolase
VDLGTKHVKLTGKNTDITTPHKLTRALFHDHVDTLADSPLANWSKLFLHATFEKIASLYPSTPAEEIGLELHDPLTIWYAATASDARWQFVNEDVRVETAGQWTRGACVVDRRGKVVSEGKGEVLDEVVGDAGGWLDSRRGNRVDRCVASLGTEAFASYLLTRVFGEV